MKLYPIDQARLARPTAVGVGYVVLDVVMSAEDDQTYPRSFVGGTCANVLTILSYLGWTSYPIARLGCDEAGRILQEDFKRWGVALDGLVLDETARTPILIEFITREHDGVPAHEFDRHCPHCGVPLPAFAPIADPEAVHLPVGTPDVFFCDRPSEAAVLLARQTVERGGLVVIEPSSVVGDEWSELLSLAHILKYSDQRIAHPLIEEDQRPKNLIFEVQTMGERGVRYRDHRTEAPRWSVVPSFGVSDFEDSCGAGDWCTAGLIDALAQGGQARAQYVTAEEVEGALRRSQAMAAWNCHFQAARGGMYRVSKEAFEYQIEVIQRNGHLVPTLLSSGRTEEAGTPFCVVCEALDLDDFSRSTV